MLTKKQHQLLHFIHQRLKSTGVSPSFDEMKDALGLASKSGIHRLITALEERGFIRRLPNKARALDVIRLPEGGASFGSDQGRGSVQSVLARPSPSVQSDAEKTGRAVSQADQGYPGGTILPFSRPSAADADVAVMGDQADASREVRTQKAAKSSDAGIMIPLHGRIAAGTPVEALENSDNFVSVPEGMIGAGLHYALTVDGDSMIEAGILDGDTIVIAGCDTARDGEIIVALVDGQEATLKKIRRAGREIELIPSNRQYQVQRLAADRVRIQGRLVGLLRRY
ncbi:LexA repressor [alpha proteobacterium Q-1]|nr:LexA repressor [alpha proteobacterium Q-1]